MTLEPSWMGLPLVRLALTGATLALLPLAWWWSRHRATTPAQRQRALVVLVLFLTFDLIVFGAFTRLTDSGLGCPDWPGCYGQASPVGARASIEEAEQLRPHGPVTQGKAWIEMIHRYLASMVGALIIVMVVLAHRWKSADRAQSSSVAWAWLTLVWVCLQGAFGAWTVTLKLYPAIVSLHLLGGLILLALLVVQSVRGSLTLAATVPVGRGQVGPWFFGLVWCLVMVQAALGAWVSTNYAVLACNTFPTCQGAWWPDGMALDLGFTLFRSLGMDGSGQVLPFEALVGIHVVHRGFAVIVTLAIVALAWRLWATSRRDGLALLGALSWQVASGISNVVLGWPLLAALAHTAGAAVLVGLLTRLWVLSRNDSGIMVDRSHPAAHAPGAQLG